MKEFDNTVSKISDHLLKKYDGCFAINRNGNLTFNGSNVGIKKLYEDDVDSLQSLGVLFDFMKSDKTQLEASIKGCISVTLKNKLDEVAFAEAEAKEAEISRKLKDAVNLNLEDVHIMLDIDGTKDRNHENKFLINVNTNEVLESPSVLGFKAIIGDPKFKTILEFMTPSRKKYAPYMINDTFNDRRWVEPLKGIDSEVSVFNTCIHPAWRYERDTSLELSKEDLFFIESSFRSKEDLQYFIDAAYMTIVNKMHAYVLLFGIKGTGKTTLVEMLINCVGSSNYRKAPQNALTSNFNAYKKDKRLVLMDEFSVNTTAVLNLLKSDANKEINIEGKNKESVSVENFVSAWFASNNLRDWSFTYDERRFSTLELVATTTLERGISDEFMGDFAERVTTDDFSQRLFNYFEKNKSVNFNPMLAHKSDLFYKIVASSLTGWQSAIVDNITTGEKIDELSMELVVDEKEKYAVRRHITVEDFIENYRHYDKETNKTYSLGKYVRGKSIMSSYIVPSEKYRAPTNNLEMED